MQDDVFFQSFFILHVFYAFVQRFDGKNPFLQKNKTRSGWAKSGGSRFRSGLRTIYPNNFSDVHIVVIMVRVIFGIAFPVDKARRVNPLNVQLAAHDCQLGLFKQDGIVVKDGAQAGFGGFVYLAAGLFPAVFHNAVVGFRQEADGKSVAHIHKEVRVPLRADVHRGHMLAPQFAKLPPTDRHGVPIFLGSGTEQRPPVAEQVKRRKEKIVRVTGCPIHNYIPPFQ